MNHLFLNICKTEYTGTAYCSQTLSTAQLPYNISHFHRVFETAQTLCLHFLKWGSWKQVCLNLKTELYFIFIIKHLLFQQEIITSSILVWPSCLPSIVLNHKKANITDTGFVATVWMDGCMKTTSLLSALQVVYSDHTGKHIRQCHTSDPTVTMWPKKNRF